MEAFAENPQSFANVVTELKGSRARRLRICGFRVIFEETDTEFVVTAIGPRGSIYD
jgi:mRNA interferase RelE/StbE